MFYELLRQTNDKQGAAAGIRIYYGRDNAGLVRMILVPYDSSGNDIINHIIDLNGKPVSGEKVEALSVSGGQTIQDGQRCPTVCDNRTSGLNEIYGAFFIPGHHDLALKLSKQDAVTLTCQAADGDALKHHLVGEGDII